VLLLDVAVGKTRGEPAESLVRVAPKTAIPVHRAQAFRREGVTHGGSEVHLRKSAAALSRTAFPDSHRRKQERNHY
jgi:hypothetical protein